MPRSNHTLKRGIHGTDRMHSSKRHRCQEHMFLSTRHDATLRRWVFQDQSSSTPKVQFLLIGNKRDTLQNRPVCALLSTNPSLHPSLPYQTESQDVVVVNSKKVISHIAPEDKESPAQLFQKFPFMLAAKCDPRYIAVAVVVAKQDALRRKQNLIPRAVPITDPRQRRALGTVVATVATKEEVSSGETGLLTCCIGGLVKKTTSNRTTFKWE